MHLCKIVNDVVVNIALFDGAVPDNWVPEGEEWIVNNEARIGWLRVNGQLVAPPEPPAPPPDNYPAMIERRAKALEAAGDEIGALKLRLSI